ncbi:MAG: hypothetical protein AABY89_00245 [Acidobacteriota bacterium]
MAEVEQTLFTVGVFQDVAWAERGIDALKRRGFTSAALSVLVKDAPDAAAFVERMVGVAPQSLAMPAIGAALGHGSLLDALQGTSRDLARVGMAAAIRRVGFQPHDGLIFETLTGRGGVLVAIEDAPRAADALAVMHSYGGGNAAIGAWAGRV